MLRTPCLLEHPHCAGEAYMDIVSGGGSAASGVDCEIPTTCSLVYPRAEETAGKARGAPLPPGGRPARALCENATTAAHADTDVVCWAVFQTLLELASKKGTETGLVPSEVDPATGAMVFVFTDIMNSTGLLAMCCAIEHRFFTSLRFAEAAAANPKCMHNVQQVHDFVVRESLSKNRGFEIGTQGDAFECAFVSVVDAVNFALEVQTRLHNAHWPKDVLNLPGWGSITNTEGDVMLRGPRVRIGIHLAACGEWVRYTHRLTRQHIFHGPGYDIAAVISDAANGGQTLLTRVTLDALLPRMRAARFPVVQPIGTFTWDGLSAPIELFSVQPIGSPLNPLRVFMAPLRKIEMVGPAEGLAIIQPPAGRERAQQMEPGFTWVDAPTARAPISFVTFEVKNPALLLNETASVALLQEKLEICAAQVQLFQVQLPDLFPTHPGAELRCTALHKRIRTSPSADRRLHVWDRKRRTWSRGALPTIVNLR